MKIECVVLLNYIATMFSFFNFIMHKYQNKYTTFNIIVKNKHHMHPKQHNHFHQYNKPTNTVCAHLSLNATEALLSSPGAEQDSSKNVLQMCELTPPPFKAAAIFLLE